MDSLASDLTSATANLGQSVVRLASVTTGTLEEEVNYVRAVYPESRTRLDSINRRMLKLANDLAGHANDSWDFVRNIRDEYAPRFTDTLDDMFERVDECLDQVQGRKAVRNLVVKDAKPTKKRLLLESDPDKLAVIKHSSVFVPDRYPYEKEVKVLYKDEQELPLIGNIGYEQDMGKTPFEWIEDVGALTRLAVALEQETVIAVDLENHSFHSYHGYLCLMQISTKTHDYVVDTIALRTDIGRVLGDIFANPGICKVFHGAQSDIQWLQRDFNIFIVNMFDTFFASKTLNFSAHSLASLLHRFCKVETDKQYQLADWRLRPLPKEMLKYARMDTHYLLHIFSQLVIALQEKGGKDLTISVFRRSCQSATSLYKPDSSDHNVWRSIVSKSSVPYSDREVAAVKAICAWREKVAFEEDESAAAVMPSYMIMRIAQGSGHDPEVVIRTCKHVLKAALKHVDLLKLALTVREHAVQKPEVNVLASTATSTHIKFPDSEDELEAEARVRAETRAETEAGAEESTNEPTAVTVAAPPRKISKISFSGHSVGNSMAGMFTGTQKGSALSVDTTKSVATSMSIVKVTRAAAKLDLERLPDIPTVESDDIPEEASEPVFVLRSGETFEAEEILIPSKLNSKKISLAKPNPTAINVSEENVDILAESRLLFGDEKYVNHVPPEKIRPKNLAEGIKVTMQPRLSNVPKSGNRTMTFTPNK